MSAGAAVSNYKRLAEVERTFRTLKGVDLHVRPIRPAPALSFRGLLNSSGHHRAQYPAPQRREARDGDLQAYHRGQPEAAAGPPSICRRHRGVGIAAPLVSSISD